MSIRLTDGEIELLKRPESAPVEERGHWRCVFRLAPGYVIAVDADKRNPGWLRLGDEAIAPHRFASKEAADAAGRRVEAWCKTSGGPHFEGWRYVRAEFFPDYSGERP